MSSCASHLNLKQDWRKAKIRCKASTCSMNPADSTPRPSDYCCIIGCKSVFLDFRKERRIN